MNTTMSLDAAELKTLVTVESYFLAHDSSQDATGRWRCLRSASHANSDVHHSVTISNGRAKCWSQGCFGEKGSDIFGVVGVVEHLSDFKSQRRRVQELAGVPVTSPHAPRQILRRFLYRDGHNREAWKLRWDTDEPGEKCTWARDPDGLVSGKGDCQPTLYMLERVKAVERVIVCEGERDADTVNSWLVDLGITDMIATTTPNGAGDVKAEYLAPLLGKAMVYQSGDNDKGGRNYLALCTERLRGQVPDLRILSVPEGVKDWTDWRERGATAHDFHRLLNDAPTWTPKGETQANLAALLTENSIHAYRPHPPHESNFHPVAAPELLAEPPEEVDWIMEEYLSAGGLILLAGKPKEGKTTLAYELAIKVALGLPFLGRNTRKASVLILALEEHAREVRMRLRNLGAIDLDNVYVHVGPLEPTTTAMDSIKSFAQSHGVRLILVDTLSAFWRIENENDAAEMTKVVKPLLQLARESGACVLLIHHARKSEGQYGDEIRGSGALFAAVDVAIVMKRHEVHTQRLLQAQSRYPETPSELVIVLRDHGYEALGDPAKVGKEARLTKLAASLSDQWEEAEQIANLAVLSQREGHRLLGLLVKEGKAVRDGKGVKNSPFRFKRNSIHAGGQSIGHESNDIKPDSIHATPPSPCTNGIPDALTEEVVDLVD